MGLPGVRVGPLDPESTKQFGQIGAGQTARQALRLHSQMYPQELKRQLTRPLDEPRTRGLDRDEVRDYLGGLKLPNGDPMIPEGHKFAGAAVRGDRDTGYVLTFQVTTPNGRVTKWFAPYNDEVLPGSFDNGAENARLHELRERGIVAHDSEGTHTQILERQLAASRAETRRLREVVEGRSELDPEDQEPGEEPEYTTDVSSQENLVDELERARVELEELRAFKASHDRASVESGGGQPIVQPSEGDESAGEGAASQEPPFDGYDDLKADQVAERLRDEDTSDEERQAILDYERGHANRKTVITAGEQSLSRE